MKFEKIQGLINAPFTPFFENGEVNYEPIEAYADMLAKNGLKGVFINGSSGGKMDVGSTERFQSNRTRWQHRSARQLQTGTARAGNWRIRYGRHGISFPQSGQSRGTGKILRRNCFRGT